MLLSGTPRPRIAFWKTCLGWAIMKAITCGVCRGTSTGRVSPTDGALSRTQEQACVGRTPLKPLPVWPLQILDLLLQHQHTREFPVHLAVKDCTTTTHSKATQTKVKSDEISWDASNSFMTFLFAWPANTDLILRTRKQMESVLPSSWDLGQGFHKSNESTNQWIQLHIYSLTKS